MIFFFYFYYLLKYEIGLNFISVEYYIRIMRKGSRDLIVYGVEKLNTILLANNNNQRVS